MVKYFYTDGKEKYGPFTKDELSNQSISRNTKVWCLGMDDWRKLSQVSELESLFNSIPPEINTKHSAAAVAEPNTLEPEIEPIKYTEDKSKSPKETTKLSPGLKWLSLSVGAILIALITYLVIQNQSEIRRYNEIVTNSYDSDEDFEMYVQKFYRDIGVYGIYPRKPKVQIIKFSKLDQLENLTHYHGLSCGFNDDEKIEIYINPSTWQKFNKPMRYFLMYHELAHDVLNLDDLDEKSWNEGRLMYPSISSYEKVTMDDFIESSHKLFEEISELK